MAKPIKATPVITGRDADRIVQEIRYGTPKTTERQKTASEAREVYTRYFAGVETAKHSSR